APGSMAQNELCPCGSELAFSKCCEPYHQGKAHPPTPEALMRSRYSAFVKHAIPYLEQSLEPSQRKEFDEKSVRKWSEESDWLGLKVLKAEGGGDSDDTGTVEFIANYAHDGKTYAHHEI